VCVCVCVFICRRPYFSELHLRSPPNCLCLLPMAVTRSSPGGVVIRYVLPFLWMTSCLLISQGCSTRRRPAEAQRTRSCGLDYKLCAVIPVAGQQTQGTTFRALKVTSQVAVYDCIVSAASHDEYIRCRATCLLFLFFMGITITPTLTT